MPDRLAELRRQRALVQEHLAWLEREIARTGGDAGAAPSATAGSVPAVSAAPVAAREPSDASVEKIVAHYRTSPDAVRDDVRRGCFLYFAIALMFLALAVAGLWFALRPTP